MLQTTDLPSSLRTCILLGRYHPKFRYCG